MGHSRQSRLLLLLSLLVAGFVVMTPPHVRPAGYNQVSGAQRRVMEEQQSLARAAMARSLVAAPARLLTDVGPEDEGPAAPNRGVVSLEASLRLFLFVVFHDRLVDTLYRELRVPPAQELVATEENTTTLLANHGVTFLATNPRLKKHYNRSNPLFAHRMVSEWRTPHYDRRCIQARLHDFGAMRSVFCNGWSGAAKARRLAFCASPPDAAPPKAAPGALGLDVLFPPLQRGALPEYVGVVEYDMAFGSGLLQLLRRRIARTSRLDTPVPSTAPPPAAAKSKHMAAALRMSPRLRRTPSPGAAAAIPRCCVFYAITHPTAFLLHNALGRRLLRDYNTFYGANRTVQDMRPTAVLDALIVSTTVYNELLLFVLSVAHGVMRTPAGACRPKGVTLDPQEYPSTEVDGGAASPLEVLERAQALWLALLPDDVAFVAVPLKHRRLEAARDI